MPQLPSPAAQAPKAYRPVAPAAHESDGPPGTAAQSAASPSLAHRRRVLSADLLEGAREIEIEHAGAVYRLRRTSLGKLILTK